MQRITFSKIPESSEEFDSLAQVWQKTPFGTAALMVLAFSVYPKNINLSLDCFPPLFIASDILSNSSLSNVSFANIFSQSLAYILITLMVSFAEQNNFKF